MPTLEQTSAPDPVGNLVRLLPKTECLNEEIFDSLADARRKLALWRYDYNNVRPHSSLGNKTSAEARRALAQPEIDQPEGRSTAMRPAPGLQQLCIEPFDLDHFMICQSRKLARARPLREASAVLSQKAEQKIG